MIGKVKITSEPEPEGGRFDEWLGGDVHTLKTWPQYWDAVRAGVKPFEVRKSDRDFKVGDTLELIRWNPDTAQEEPVDFEGSCVGALICKITYILPGGGFGIEEGTCILGLDRVLLLKG